MGQHHPSPPELLMHYHYLADKDLTYCGTACGLNVYVGGASARAPEVGDLVAKWHRDSILLHKLLPSLRPDNTLLQDDSARIEHIRGLVEAFGLDQQQEEQTAR